MQDCASSNKIKENKYKILRMSLLLGRGENQEETLTQQTTKQNIVLEQKENKGYETVNSFDPVRILVDSCKKHETPVELSLNMNLPSKYIANIASSEFKDGFDKFIDCIVKDIDTKLIISELKKALKQAYSESITIDEN